MKDKWTAYWITGLSALLVIGLIGMILSKPHSKLEITVQTASSEETAAVPETKAAAEKIRQTNAQTARTEPLTKAAEATVTVLPERNLNRASAEDLKRVPGIGDALAEAVISARTACGGFTSRAQLCEIRGIGENLMQRIMAEFEIPDEIFPMDEPPPAEQQPEPEPAEPESVYIINVYDANTVTREELLTLPDMTGEKADAILLMRENLKGYHGIYELSLAEGISGEYFEHVLKAHLYVEDDPYSVAQTENT